MEYGAVLTLIFNISLKGFLADVTDCYAEIASGPQIMFSRPIKLCTKCGQWHDEIKVWDRTFKCDCGVEMDRDIHAAQNMVWFYENNVGVERTKIKRLEMKALVDQALAMESQLLSAKDEDSSL